MGKAPGTRLPWWVVPLVKVSLVALLLYGGIGWPLAAPSTASVIGTLDTLAALVALWWPGLGAVLSVPVLAVAPGYVYTGMGLISLAFTSVMAAVRWRWRAVLALAVFHATFVLYDFAMAREAGRSLSIVVMLVLCYGAGLWIRTRLGAQLRGERSIAESERLAARAREEERISLSSELAHLLVRSLHDVARSLDRAAADPDPDSVRRTLQSVGEESRTALSRLRLLVGTLRASGTHGDAVDAHAAVDWFEDELVAHGFGVEIEAPDPLPAQAPAVVSTLLRVVAESVVQYAPAGAWCGIDLRSTPDAMTLTVHCPEAPAGSLPGLPLVEEQASAAGGRFTVDDGEGLRATLHLPTPPAPARGWLRTALGSLGQDQQVVAVLSAGATLLALALTGVAAATGGPWQGNVQWAVVALGILLAVRLPWAGGGVLLLAIALAYLMPQGEFWAVTPPSVAGYALTIIVVSRVPWAAPAVLIGWVAMVLTIPPPNDFSAWDVLALALPSVLVGIGLYVFVRVRARQAAEVARLERRREEERMEERRHLASELHDIVAHQLSLIAMHLTPTSLETARLPATIAHLTRTTASARNDLTTLVRSLRSGDAEPLATRATAAAVAQTLEGAGHPVRLSLGDGLDRLDATTQKTLSRVVREAATNAMRYAPKGSPIDVEVAVAGASASVRIVNRLPALPRVDPHSTGSGLLGLRERVELTHGTFSAGEEDAHWVVAADLPLRERVDVG